ncbi:peptidoglycan-binding protein [Dactylosporangium sp. NPDC048998]|uniref:peptidoglycan-binding protein n=1 Tax=Dactylosporangium sp. NPDC048998 TaxID=3363976 RepID=UPI003712BD7D
MALVVTAVAAGVAAVLFAGGRQGDRSASVDRPESTVPVAKTDLVETQQVDGHLGYAGTASVTAGRNAMVTWLPQPGDTITRGQRVYDGDNRPVLLLYGKTPFWRELRLGVTDGPDVQILEENLWHLGYGKNLTVDNRFTAATAAVIRKWQKDRGVEQTGTVALGDVVVLPGPIRVAEVKAKTGAPASGEILTATGTVKQVTVDLPVTKSGLAVKDSGVTVGLPDGKTTTGKITAVGTIATSDGKGGGQNSAGGTPTIPVTVALDDPAVTGTLDGAPVTVNFKGEEHKGVLTVPVNALMALAEGGFGVQKIADDGNKSIITVELGAFGNGRVEITGNGVVEGMKVTVPAT